MLFGELLNPCIYSKSKSNTDQDKNIEHNEVVDHLGDQ